MVAIIILVAADHGPQSTGIAGELSFPPAHFFTASEVQAAHVSHLGREGLALREPSSRRRELGRAFFPKNQGDGRRTSFLSRLAQGLLMS